MLAVLLLSRMQNKRLYLQKQKLKSSLKSISDATTQYCRTCLGHGDLVSIFYNRETSERRSEDLKLVTGLDIKMNDNLSQKICADCIERLNEAMQFRLRCAKNDRKLRDALRNNKTVDSSYNKEHKKSNGYISVKDNSDTEDLEFEDVCYLTLDEDFKTDHDYLEMHSVKPEKPGRKKSIDFPGKVFTCSVCGKKYERKTAYRAHMNIHNNYRICEACGRRFASSFSLVQHQRARHARPRVHTCPLCDYSSATKAGLVTHSRRHTGERPYMCAHCAAAFHSRSGLVQHLPIHLTESNFECPICHKREKSKRLLQHHHYKAHRPKKCHTRPPCDERSLGEERNVL